MKILNFQKSQTLKDQNVLIKKIEKENKDKAPHPPQKKKEYYEKK